MSAKTIFIATCLLLAPTLTPAKDCIPTPHRTTGTHYAPVTVEKINISKGVMVQGRVLNSACEPVPNAKVAHWQAGKDGKYSDRLRAYLDTDSKGVYKFETEWPDITPPHIHFIVTVDGYDILETQWVGQSPQTLIEFDMVLEETRGK